MREYVRVKPVNRTAISCALAGENVPHEAEVAYFEWAYLACVAWNNSVIPFPSRDRGGSTLLEKVD